MESEEEELLLLLRGKKIQGSGAIGTAPAPASVAVGSLWVDGAVVYQNRFVYSDAGNDRIECGTPTWLTQKTRPNIDSFDVAVYANLGTSGGNYCPLIESANSQAETVFQIAHRESDNFVQMNSGGTRVISTVITRGVWRKYLLSSRVGANASKSIVDGVILNSFTAGSFAGVYPLYIGGSATGTFVFGGKIAKVEITNALNGEIVDQYDFNNQTQWNGGLSGSSLNGFPFTITDGSPTGVRVRDWVPINL